MKKIYTNLALVLAFVAIGFTTNAQDLTINSTGEFSVTGASTVYVTGTGEFIVNPGAEVTVLNTGGIHVTGAGKQLIVNCPENSGAPGSLMNKSTTPNNITAAGDVVFNRFLSREEWHMIVSPVVDMPVEGVIPGVNNNLYYIDEENYDWIQQSTGTMVENLGYLTLNNTYVMVPFAGELYSAEDMTVFNGSYALSGSEEDKGWNFIGNKFTCAIDLNQVIGMNITQTFYVWDYDRYVTFNSSTLPNGVTYETADGFDGIIAATQGFSYKVTDPVNSITIPQAAKIHNTTIFRKKTKTVQDNLLALNVSGNNKTSEMKLFFYDGDEMTEGFDSKYDAYRLFSWNDELAELYTIGSDNSPLSTDIRPQSVMENYTVAMGFRVMTAGNYTIDVSEFTFDKAFPVLLEDTNTGERIELGTEATYSFRSEAGEFSGRFNLLFNPLGVPTGIENVADGSSINIYTNKKALYINLNTSDLNKARVEIYNLVGSKVVERELNTNQTILDLDLISGDYIVKVSSGIDTKVSKVFVN